MNPTFWFLALFALITTAIVFAVKWYRGRKSPDFDLTGEVIYAGIILAISLVACYFIQFKWGQVAFIIVGVLNGFQAVNLITRKSQKWT